MTSSSSHSIFPLPVTICILAHNEEQMIEDCLASVLGKAAEVLVLDAESQDATAHKVKAMGKDHPELRLISAPNIPNFDRNKNLIFEQATQEWLFYLDADERFTPQLWEEMALALEEKKYAGYRVGRKNFYFGRWLRHGGMYPELQPRLFRKGLGSFPGDHLHQTLIIKGEVGDLDQPFIHLAYRNVSQFLVKLDSYTSVQAVAWKKQGVQWSLGAHLQYGILRPIARFFQKYLVLGGILDGFLGFFAAWMSGLSEFIAYVKVGVRNE